MIGFRVCAIALACTSVLTGCSGGHAPPAGGVVRFAVLIEPETLNPLLGATVATASVAALVFDGLVRVDAKGQPVPDLATAVPSRANGGISGDGKSLTYHLDPRAQWHDGTPVTADDVVFTWHAIMSPHNNVAARDGYDQIAAIDAVDAHTVRVRLRRIYAPALFLFTPSIVGAILPKHLLARYADLNKQPFNASPVGSGPYRFREWRHGDRLIFEANPAYFRGPPSIGRVEMRVIPDTNTLLNLIRTHEIDATVDVSADHVRDVQHVPGVITTLVPTNAFAFFSFNTRRAPLDDVRVRQALCYAIDPKRIFDVVYHGVGVQAPTDQSPASGWADPTVHYYPTDLARAAALLDAAGWRLQADGHRYRAGHRLLLEFASVAGSKTAESIEVLAQAAWARVGIETRIKNAPGSRLFAQTNGILNDGLFDVAYFSYTLNPDPNDAAIIGPDTVPPRGENETGYVGDAKFAQLLHDASGTYDLARRHELYNRLQHILIRDVPRYTVRWVSAVQVNAANLHGLAINPAYNPFWNVRDWTLSRP